MFRKQAARQALDDTTDAIGSAVSAVPVDSAVDAVGELAGDVGDLAIDVVEAAAATTRVGVRLTVRTFRFIVRHPRGVLAGLVILVALGAIAGYVGNRDSSNTAT